ncbi:DUF2809 domain-containing protein [Cellulophaga baltica]|uniref:ribosomal maturation YjgA family protein n=1 Tax=Cellulophaga baltica TaxID=76594 RepID=UPI0024954554|nr:DUF2809 domain-containing protein [Cellulophaga baltica]
MKFTFNNIHFIAFSTILALEIAIAYYLKTGFIRHTVGDFLVVILIYCFLRSFIKTNPLSIAVITLVLSYTVEFLQRTTFLQLLNLDQNKWANLIFGNSFSIQDLVAYTLGVLAVTFIDIKKSNAYKMGGEKR